MNFRTMSTPGRARWIRVVVGLALVACNGEARSVDAPRPKIEPSDAATPATTVAADNSSGNGTSRDGPRRVAPEVTLKSAGAPPRLPLVYDFTDAKTYAVVASKRVALRDLELGIETEKTTPRPIRLTLEIARTGPVEGTRTRFGLKVRKLEVLAEPRAPLPNGSTERLEQVAASLSAMGVGFSVDTHGVVGDFAVGASDGTEPEVAEFVPLLQQALEPLFALTPNEAVGIGAEWVARSVSPDGNGSLEASYTLVTRTRSAAVVRIRAEGALAPHPVADALVGPGATVEGTTKVSYTLTIRLDGPAKHATGEREERIVTRDPSTSPPRAITTVVKSWQTLEPAATGTAP